MSDATPKEPRKIKCPRCGNPTVYAPENRWRPFCSERCKLIDLGQWANEEFRVPAQQPPSLEDLPEPSSEDDFNA